MVFEGRAPYLWWETDRRVSTPSMLRVDYDRWGQTPEELRQLATSAAHQRTRERFLALYDPALFMPTGGLPRILRSSARVFLSEQGMNQNSWPIGYVGGVSPKG